MQTIKDIIKQERKMVLEAEVKYGTPFKNALGFNHLLGDFIKEATPGAWIFVMFLSQIRKSLTLAVFSAVRLHEVQARMNQRHAIEAGVNAAYALANPNPKDFYIEDEQGTLHSPQRLMNKRYRWLEQNHKNYSDFLKTQKDIINSSVAHSNIIFAFNNFSVAKMKERRFETPFFDIEHEFRVKNILWFNGNLAMGLMDLFYGINQSCNRITFKDNFVQELKTLEEENHRIKAELTSNPRIARLMP